jgi:toxin ParE1/3/4
MAIYRLSRAAEEDVAEIFEFGVQHFGLHEARKYLEALEQYLITLSDNPAIGALALELSPANIRRFPFKAHVIFYIPLADDVLIVRILSHRMDVDQHFR